MHITAYSDGRVHFEQVGLSTQNFASLPDDPQRLLLGQATFAVEMLLEKVDVGLLAGLVLEELLIGRGRSGGCLDIWNDSKISNRLFSRIRPPRQALADR